MCVCVCVVASERWKKNKVVSKCRAERRRAAGLGDGTICGGEERSLKLGTIEMIPKSGPLSLVSLCLKGRPQPRCGLVSPAELTRPAVLLQMQISRLTTCL